MNNTKPQKWDRIRILRDVPERPPWHPLLPVFRAGEVISARRVDFPARGWIASMGSDPTEYLLVEGEDAELCCNLGEASV